MLKRPGLLAIAALVAAGLPGAARADNLDQRLHEEMPSIVKKLTEKKYTNIGVLPFRVQRGTGKAGFNTPLSGNLPRRVENLLIIHGNKDEEKTLGVIRDAGRHAYSKKITTWFENDAAQKKLLAIKDYPLAWGEKKVKPDVFLTGLVQVSKDRRKTTVTLQYFDTKSTTLAELGNFTIRSDRNILRDLGYSFALSAKARGKLTARRTTADDSDDEAFEQLPPDEKTDPGENDKPKDKPKRKPDTSAQPDDTGGVRLVMLVDGKPVKIDPSSSEETPFKWQVQSPAAGQIVTFKLENTSAARRGIVLKLNGMSTVNNQTDDSERCRKWVLDAGETLNILGYYKVGGGKDDDDDKDDNKGKSVESRHAPFKVVVDAEAEKAKELLGDNAGVISLDVFEVGTEARGTKVSSKGLPPSKEKKARESYVGLRSALIRSARLKTMTVAAREVIVADSDEAAEKDGPDIKLVSFDNPQIVGSIAIKVMARESQPE